MTTTDKVPAIYSALAEVMKGIANVPKNGTMSFGKTSYEYLKADDVQEKLNPLLVENGIIVQSTYDVIDAVRNDRAHVYVHLDLNYISVKDGSSLNMTAVGECIAGDDKSVNKALTQAIKNCHRATFQFASGEVEPDDLAPGSEAAPKAAPQALVKAREAAAKKTEPAVNGVGDSKTLITKEFVTPGLKTIDEVKELVRKVEAEKKLKSGTEELYSAVLDRLRADARQEAK